MAFPVTVAVPTVVPPDVHVEGALAWGPKTVKVTVPVAFEPELDAKVEVIDPVGIAAPTAELEGPLAVSVGEAFETTVSDIPDPQVLVAALLLVSPP